MYELKLAKNEPQKIEVRIVKNMVIFVEREKEKQG